MIKYTYFFSFADGVDAADGDRWYVDEFSAREASLPGVQRLASWRIREAPQPAEVKRPLNTYHRMTEVWCSDEAAWTQHHAALLDSERGRHFGELKGIIVTAAPEYDLRRDAPPQHYQHMGLPIEWSTGKRPDVAEPTGEDMWRFVYFFRYRDDVTFDDGEDWYLGHHTREGKQLPGVMRYVTWRRLGRGDLTSGAAGEARHFVRYTELCFDSFETWYRVLYQEGPRWRMSDKHPTGVWTDYHNFFTGIAPDLVRGRDLATVAEEVTI